MTIQYDHDPQFVPDDRLRVPGGTGRILYEVRPSEPIKEKPMSKTKTELTDELAQETYDQLYIGKSTSLARCAKILETYPQELRAKWRGKRLRNESEAQRAKHRQGKPWQWDAAETTLAQDLGLNIPDGDGKGYDNGHMPAPAAQQEEDPTAVLEAIAATNSAMGKAWAKATDPGPSRQAIEAAAFDTLAAAFDTLAAAAETNHPVSFRIQDGKVIDEQPAPAVTAAGLQKFAAALTDTTLRFALTDMKAEADPEVNTIRAFLGAELKRQSSK